MIYIGIDNGVTGSIGIISGKKVKLFTTPCFIEQSYTKAKGNISRIDHKKLYELLMCDPLNSKAYLERPMVNPKRWKASVSALRALESTLIVVETLEIPYEYIDSKEWQKVLLPKGVKGATELKKASLDIGCRLFPKWRKEIHKQGDADGLLIAEYLRRKER